ncbi:MAG: hypothetical protein ACYS7Y_32860 [Planctomycetota bacterium]|jgi:hypothetical protein
MSSHGDQILFEILDELREFIKLVKERWELEAAAIVEVAVDVEDED